jgi:hypothetical protein
MGVFNKLFGRLRITSDANVSTQTTSIIQTDTTNSSIAIVPNGTGAIIASIPDGTVTGGNARGPIAVDLQRSRNAATQVASGDGSFIGGGIQNTAVGIYATIVGGERNTTGANVAFIGGGGFNSNSGREAVICGGYANTITQNWGTISGGNGNNNSSTYGTISGGQSNTASTNTHATVVGGSSNTSSGQGSISGGSGNTASGGTSLSIGLNNIASTESSIALGRGNTAAGVRRNYAIGENNTVTGYDGSAALGQGNNVSGVDAAIAIGRLNTISGTTSFGFGNANSVTANESYAFGKSNSVGSGLSIALGVGNNLSVTPANSSMVAIGFNHKTSGSFSTSMGNRSWAYLYGQIAHAAEWFSVNNDWGNAQQSVLLARREATLTTGATTILSLDGTGTTNLIIPLDSNRMWNVQIDTIAVVRTITGTATGVSVGDAYRETKQLLFKRVGGTSSIVGTVDTTAIKNDSSLATCALTVTAGASQEMALTFTGATFAGGGSVTMRVVSKIMLVEVAY